MSSATRAWGVSATRRFMQGLIGCVLAVGIATAADVDPVSTAGRSAATRSSAAATAIDIAPVASGQVGSASAVPNAAALRNATAVRVMPRSIPLPLGRQVGIARAAPVYQAGTTVRRPLATIAAPSAMARTAVVGGPRSQHSGSLGGPASSSSPAHGVLSGTALRRHF